MPGFPNACFALSPRLSPESLSFQARTCSARRCSGCGWDKSTRFRSGCFLFRLQARAFVALRRVSRLSFGTRAGSRCRVFDACHPIFRDILYRLVVVVIKRIAWCKDESTSVRTRESHFKQSLLLVDDLVFHASGSVDVGVLCSGTCLEHSRVSSHVLGSRSWHTGFTGGLMSVRTATCIERHRDLA